jgi:hypothetical protein
VLQRHSFHFWFVFRGISCWTPVAEMKTRDQTMGDSRRKALGRIRPTKLNDCSEPCSPYLTENTTRKLLTIVSASLWTTRNALTFIHKALPHLSQLRDSLRITHWTGTVIMDWRHKYRNLDLFNSPRENNFFRNVSGGQRGRGHGTVLVVQEGVSGYFPCSVYHNRDQT